MSFGLGSDAKILKASEYAAIFKGGEFAKGKYWQVVAESNGSKPRLGLAISKKFCRLAVDRNRLKRIARETFRLQKQNLNNLDFVVLTKHQGHVKNSVLAADLADLFNKMAQN
ncbi:MAG: ribonuclease P protein component [Candidatus Thioglobus sp.]|nr:MAG: ribonuclease P protein component [Candidatus Thioglobus sp.]KAA0450635.1 MAG: ribonuclease P protein component [Candidatus Thioglobus sp.]